jgi:DNA-binding GntR family transcriptional regulator
MENRRTTKTSLSQRAYEKIRSMVLHLELKPGERIPEEMITEIVNGSRTPVREALRRLNEEGLVRIYPGRYSEVACYDKDAIKEIGELRLAQDLLACKLAIRNGSNSDFEILKQIAKKCEVSAKKGDIYERIAFDLEFHLEIAKIGKNKLLIQNQKILYMKIHLIQISKYTNIEDSISQIKTHNDIINAIYNRDYRTVKSITCEHLEDFYEIDQEIINMYMCNDI